MLGELLGEERGQTTSIRVLPTETTPRLEISFTAQGTLLGEDVTDMGTYISAARPDGTMYGEGQGVMMTAKGEMASWKGQGVGRFTRPGAVAWRGAIYFETTSKKLAKLNGVAVVYEFESDEGGKTESKNWEWK